MKTVHSYAKTMGLIFLVLTLTLIISGSYVSATQLPPPANFDFVIAASRTLIKMQPGASGSVAIWVQLFCPNSTANQLCDSTQLQTVSLQLSGCPSSLYCMMDRAVVLAPPLYTADSNLVVYSFALNPCVPIKCSNVNTNAATISVTGIDQWGHTHTAQFGVIVCYC
jgi:hypothetical protein